MDNYKYILDNKSKKFICPECNKRTFVKYIDTGTGEYLPDHYGRCDREIKCSYFLNPYQDGYAKENDVSVSISLKGRKQETRNQHSFIETNILQNTLKNYDENIFTQYLLKKFGKEITEKAIEKYFIGTSKHWPGATIFWQVDISGKVRTGKIMLYDENLHRVKKPFDKIDWVHNVLKIENFSLKQCLYGEHLLKDNTMPAALIESEKTAIIASIYLPQFIWLACGNLNGLNIEKIKSLQGRKVFLFPDLNAFVKWSIKAKEFEKELPGTSIKVSDLLERKASEAEKAKGLDIADYLLRFDVKDFREKEIKPIDILIDNIISIPWETITGNEFEKMNIVWIKTIHGNYDILFDKEGEPVKEYSNTVRKLAMFFNKDFKDGFLNGKKCLMHGFN